MGTTTIRAIPYPAASDPADVPTDMQELADRLDALWLVSGQSATRWMLMGNSSVVTTSAAGQASITFPFTVSSVTVLIVANGDAGIGDLVVSPVGLPTTTGFTIKAVTNAGANFVGTARINWLALVVPV